ncbi:hypothetical protein M3Y96_00239000 [Aphelenchoides besseyi]|nr:hypothetical protein M3Y96_00239000 [Aphelenchoides besseyi]
MHATIYSALAGVVQVTTTSQASGDDQRVVSVSGRFDEKKYVLPTNGGIVTARVESLCLRYAKCSIICIGHTHLMDEFSATLRKEDARELDKDNVELYKCVQPGDLILARVIGVGDTQTSFLLSIAENELGVTFAIGQNGEKMVPDTLAAVKDRNSEYREPLSKQFVFSRIGVVWTVAIEVISNFALMTQDLMPPYGSSLPLQSTLSAIPTPPMNGIDEQKDLEIIHSDHLEDEISPTNTKPLLQRELELKQENRKIDQSLSSDSDKSEEEDNSEFEQLNAYAKILNSKSDADRPANWRSMVLFSGRILPSELPENCPRPQLSNGALAPEVQSLVQNLMLPDGTLRKPDSIHFATSTTVSKLLNHNNQKETRGYVLSNGLTWVRHKTPSAEKTQPSAVPWKRKNANLSLVIAGEKRIYSGTSNECYAFAQTGECAAGVFCFYDHNGKSDHRTVALQMMGLCRNSSNCSFGRHALAQHQMPVCDYYLRIQCAEEDCCYLHIKHQDNLEYCSKFQTGICKLGLRCPKPHRYNVSRIHQKCSSQSKEIEANGLVFEVGICKRTHIDNQRAIAQHRRNRTIDRTSTCYVVFLTSIQAFYLLSSYRFLQTGGSIATRNEQKKSIVDNMSVKTDGEEANTRGRPRRSAAAGSKTWAALMPKHKQDDEENDEPATPKLAPRKKARIESTTPKPVVGSETKPVERVAARPPASTVAKSSPAVTRIQNSNGNNGAAAIGKEQLANIEVEMIVEGLNEFNFREKWLKHEDEPSDDDDDYSESGRKPAKRPASKTPRSSGGKAQSTAKSQAAAAFSHQYPMKNMLPRTSVVQKTSTYVQPRVQPIRPIGIQRLRYAAPGYSATVNENRPMFVLRQPGKIAETKTSGSANVGSTPLTISSTSVQNSKEIDEINKKFGERLVSGDKVQKFNNLINGLHEEMKLMAEDRLRMVQNHEETVEQMGLAHSAALDIKASRIRQLENYVGRLQNKISQLNAQLQCALSEHESSKDDGNTLNDDQVPKTIKSNKPSAVLTKAKYDNSDEPMDSAEAAAEREELGEFDSVENSASGSPQEMNQESA